MFRTVFFLFAFPVIAACAQNEKLPFKREPDGRFLLHDHEERDFEPEKVSCVDRTNLGSRVRLEKISKHPDSVLYWTAHLDEILKFTREMAEQGNIRGMGAFGFLKRVYLIEEYRADEGRGLLKNVIMPDREKMDMVVAMTFLYINSFVMEKREGQGAEIVDSIEKNNSYVRIPPEWITEAKANAEGWIKRCRL